MKNNYYIYIYLDSRKSGRYCYENFSFLYKPFYIGKGKNKRYLVECGRNPLFKNKINKIKKLGFIPIVFKLYENLNEKQSFEFETKLIKEIGRIDLGTGPLVNMTDGGEGKTGYKFSEDSLNKLRKDFLNIDNEFRRRNCILLTKEDEYKNCYSKLKYICPGGHINYISWSHFKPGGRCPYCSKKKIYFSEIKKEFEKRDYMLLTEEKDYKNNKQKLQYVCPKEHSGSITWSDFQKESGCSVCGNELVSKKMRGKNSILIIQDVIQIKLLLKEGILTQQEIADIFGVSGVTISDIKKEKIWGYIKIL